MRLLTLSNGEMLVGINEYGIVRDFYYPYIGLENHMGKPYIRHKLGVMFNDKFSWLDDGTWDITVKYERNALMGSTTAKNENLGISLELRDFVDSESTTFGRRIVIKNENEEDGEISVFTHQAFKISESGRGDTALFAPEAHAILDYKGHRAFAISGRFGSGESFDQHSIGNYGIEGKEGTYKDAEDGELGGNNIEHGQVDSVLRFKSDISKHRLLQLDYWIAVAQDNNTALSMSKELSKHGLDHTIKQTKTHWRNWLKTAKKTIKKYDEKDQESIINNILIIKSHIDSRGAIIASSDSEMLNYSRDYYSYFWPRDGAYVIWPLIRLGYTKEAQNFFKFCEGVLDDGGYLLHKYLPNRTVGSSWHPYVYRHHEELPIQEDETAITIFMLNEYLTYSDDEAFVRSMYDTYIKKACEFITSFIDKETGLPHASYDLWEERFQTTTYTCSVVYGSLRAAAHIAERLEKQDDAIAWNVAADEIQSAIIDKLYNHDRNYFYRGLLLFEGDIEYDEVIDVASLYGVMLFGVLDIKDQKITDSIKALEEALVDKSPSGGVPRYEYDKYHVTSDDSLGNPWFVTTLWYMHYFTAIKNKERVNQIIDWVSSKRTSSGALAEQIDPQSSENLSVLPLIWSHAELTNALIDRNTELVDK